MGENTRHGETRTRGSLTPRLRIAESRVDAPIAGRFLRRYKRFFADVETPGGPLTVHCANPGSMKGFLRPGAAVRCSTSDDPRRKLRHTLEMMRIGRIWVGLHTGRANELVSRALAAGMPAALAGYTQVRREVRVDHAELSSRLDFQLSGHASAADAWLEVKSVTLCEGREARFPDSVTARGRRHVRLLEHLAARGARTALLFLVQRADCDRVTPADDIDPAYGKALRRAARRGVEVYALSARVTSRAIRIERELPVLL